MNQPFRTDTGGLIDRSRPIRFTFDGKPYQGFEGDTLASALLANGVHLMGRSFKYHRPRGLLAAGPEEPNALMQLDDGKGRNDPNSRATTIELFEGLKAESQNRYPSLRADIGALNDLLSPLFPAAFYYKTFMWPRTAWHKLYEPIIRKAAGLGRSPDQPDPDRYSHRHAHCDVLIVGAGPHGIEQAKKAAESGKDVILVDENNQLGGSILSEPGNSGLNWLAEQVNALNHFANLRILTRTTLTSYYDHNYLAALERLTDHRADKGDGPRQRLWRIRAGHVILATGALERPLVFAGNDRPGVMLASAARTFLNRYGVKVGHKAAIVTNNDSAYAAALDLHHAGVSIQAIVDIRANPHGPLSEKARKAGIPILGQSTVTGTTGRLRIASLSVASLDDQGQTTTALGRPIACDALLMSGGWNPNVALFSQSRGKLDFDETRARFVPGKAFQPTACAGACNGDFASPHTFGEPEMPIQPVWQLPGDARGGKAFVDFQNDVTAKDLGLAVREGMVSIEHVKRFTTTGMATDQGKTSNVNALAIVASQLATPIPAVGTTTFRPPYTPLTFGAIAGHSSGELFDVTRKTPMHHQAEALGAAFEDVGNWKRAWYFPKTGETMEQAVLRECQAVRTGVGIFDASTLGKIDIQGVDAREFLNRVYTNAWSKLAPGKCRYGLMLKDDGYVFDDGVTACLNDRHFHMTTTTGGAPRVLSWLEDLLQTEWTDLKVYLTSVTEQWATVALNGPKARAVLNEVTSDDLSPDTLPHMGWLDAKIAGINARIFRISFTGETAFEINVASDFGPALWDALIEAGKAHDICAYGTETMHVLRAEKGYIIVGQDTDGTVTPADLGMDWIVSKNKPDFIGKRGLARPDLQARGRKQLVGILTEDAQEVLDEGAQITESFTSGQKLPMIGHVTSSYMSPNCQRSIALALIKDGHERHGQTVMIPKLDGGVTQATVSKPIFFDPEGARLHG